MVHRQWFPLARENFLSTTNVASFVNTKKWSSKKFFFSLDWLPRSVTWYFTETSNCHYRLFRLCSECWLLSLPFSSTNNSSTLSQCFQSLWSGRECLLPIVHWYMKRLLAWHYWVLYRWSSSLELLPTTPCVVASGRSTPSPSWLLQQKHLKKDFQLP